MQSGNDQPGDVGDICHEKGAYAVGDGTEFFEVDNARIIARATNEELRFVLLSQFGHFVVIDTTGFPN